MRLFRIRLFDLIRPRPLGRAAVVLLVLVGIVALYCWRLASQSPHGWSPADASDPAVKMLGEHVENTIITELHRVRPPGTEWTIELEEEAANAWLATRFPAWARNRGLRWAYNVNEPHIRLSDSDVRLAFRHGPSRSGRPITVTLALGFEGEGIRLAIRRVEIGRLPVPATTAARLLGLGHAAAEIAAVLADDPIPAVIRLGDGRRIELTAIETEPQRIHITLRSAE